MKLVSIKDVGKFAYRRVTLVGVVVEFSIPRKAEEPGTDYVSVLRIVDDSQQSPELAVIVFTTEINLLPHVRSYGDLIVLSNVMIKWYDHQWTAVCYKNRGSFALFDASVGNDFTFYQSTRITSLQTNEKDLITRVKQWHDGVQLSTGKVNYLLTLNDISYPGPFDLICQVIRLYYDVIEKVWMLILWDGNDAPPLSLHGKLKNEERNPLPLHVYPSLVDDNFYFTFPPFGTFFRVAVHESHENFPQHFNHIGKWIKICYMTCKASSGLWCGFLQRPSSVRLLSNTIIEEYDMKIRERAVGINTRVSAWVDTSHFLTEIINDMTMPSTLIDAIRYQEVDTNYHCFVRIIAIHPFEVLDFCFNGTEHSLRLTIEDSSIRLHAFLVGVEMVQFFELCPIDERINKVKLLLGVPEEQCLDDNDAQPFSWNPPWTICCLKWVDGHLCVCSTKLKM